MIHDILVKIVQVLPLSPASVYAKMPDHSALQSICATNHSDQVFRSTVELVQLTIKNQVDDCQITVNSFCGCLKLTGGHSVKTYRSNRWH